MRADVRSRRSGFSVIEILVALALAAIVSGSALLVSMSAYESDTFKSDRDSLIALLMRARAESMHGMCLGSACLDARPHGVAILPDSYVLFQGASYASRDSDADAVIGRNPSITATGISEILFSILAATTSAGSIELTDQRGNRATITIGSLGQIGWSD